MHALSEHAVSARVGQLSLYSSESRVLSRRLMIFHGKMRKCEPENRKIAAARPTAERRYRAAEKNEKMRFPVGKFTNSRLRTNFRNPRGRERIPCDGDAGPC